ncbi:MAG TPA: hypothetical protein EYG91_01280 [Aquifex aeolicus]|nr:hypothetical protein [Aquifex aeolicus]
MRAYFLVSLLLFLLSCRGVKEVKKNALEFFLENYDKGVYRYLVLETKPNDEKSCKVVLKDLIKEQKYELTLYTLYYVERFELTTNLHCELFSKGRLVEVAGERFTPPSNLRIVKNAQLREGLYLWILERVRKSSGGGGGGIIFLPWGWGGIDYDYRDRYRTVPGRYGGK